MIQSKNNKENQDNVDEKTIKSVYTVKKQQNIEDLQITEGMDIVMEKWSYRKVIKAIKRQKIIVDPDFQRDEMYRVPQKSSIINSVFCGKLIPAIFVFEDKNPVTGKYVLSVIDGQQRLSSIRDFMTNKYNLKIPYGKYSALNGYTYEDIKKLNPQLIEDFEDSTLDINVIRGISKEEAQEYFGLINTTSVPLSPGEKLWSLHDPVKTVLRQIVNNPHFKITNLRKTRKREYLIATKLLWNQMFNNPLKHEFVGDTIQEFMNYFNTTEDIDLIESSQQEVLELLRIYSNIIDGCQYSPRSQGDLYSVICFISLMKAKDKLDVDNLSLFIDWVFKGINKQIYPITLKNQFEQLIGARVSNGHTNAKNFVIILETLYKEEMGIWKK